MSDYAISIATLIVGLILGYLGQRSRFCTISGIRDYYLMRDPYRLKGLIGVILGGAIGFTVVNLLTGNLNGYTNPGEFEIFPLLKEGINVDPTILIPLSLIGGFFMAYFSVMAEGCPFRQHVLAGEGSLSGIFYILGLICGVLFFDEVLVPLLQVLSML